MRKFPGQVQLGDKHVNEYQSILWTCVDEPLHVPGPTGFRDVKITVRMANGFVGPLWFWSHRELEIIDNDTKV